MDEPLACRGSIAVSAIPENHSLSLQTLFLIIDIINYYVDNIRSTFYTTICSAFAVSQRTVCWETSLCRVPSFFEREREGYAKENDLPTMELLLENLPWPRRSDRQAGVGTSNSSDSRTVGQLFDRRAKTCRWRVRSH